MDVLLVCDLRFPGGTSTSVVEEIRAAAAAGYRLGLLHLDSSSLSTDRPIHPLIRAELDSGAATLILPGQAVTTRLLVVKHPTLFTTPLGGRLAIKADKVILVVGQVPHDLDGTIYYDPGRVDAHLVAALGQRAVWAPVSPVVREHLRAAAESAEILLAPTDWVELIDPEGWSVDRSDAVDSERAVIGRHSRPSRMKWPSTASDLLAAYPDDGSVRVRVLGGIDGVVDVLGYEPLHWEVFAFGVLSAREFLAGIDVFVYQHHPDLVEAFGRTILEALASGAVVVVPPHFEDLFGTACLYAQPSGVMAIVERLRADPSARQRQSEIGLAELRRRFSHAAHVARVNERIGPPSTAEPRALPAPDPALIPQRQRDALPTVVVAALGASVAQIEEAVELLVVQRAFAAGFVPVIVATERPPATALSAGVQVEVITSRRNWKQAPEQWPEYAAGRLRIFVRRHRAMSVTVLDLAHPDAWIALRVRPSSSPVDAGAEAVT
jgi:hypothetical protein